MLAGSLSASLSLLAISVPWRTVSAAYVLPLEFLPSTRSGDSGTRGLRHTADLNVTGGIDVGYFYTRIQLVRGSGNMLNKTLNLAVEA